jgi:hypothetical protein
VDGNGREGGGVVRASRQRREDQPALHRAEKNRRLRHADPVASTRARRIISPATSGKLTGAPELPLMASMVAYVRSPWPVRGWSQAASVGAQAASRIRPSPKMPISAKALRGRLERSGGSMAAEAAIQDANAKPGCPTTKIRHQSRRVLLARRDLSRPDSDGNARAKQGGRSVEDGNGSGRRRSVARLDLSE